jgi:hypothetical protein
MGKATARFEEAVDYRHLLRFALRADLSSRPQAGSAVANGAVGRVLPR